MGCLFPLAEDLARYWANIRKGVDAITEVPESHWRPADYFDQDPQAPDRTYAHRGGFLTPVEFPLLEFGIAPHTLEATDTTQLLGLLVARSALQDAGYGPERLFDRDRASVILGVTGTLELVIPLGARLGHPIWREALRSSGVDEQTSAQVVRKIGESYVGWQENSFPGLLGNVAAGRIANRLDLRGANCVVDAACASSLGALNLAMLELASGRCDLAISGGLDTFNDIFMYMCFSKTPALSPSGDSRPFDAAADGTILGEGLGVLVLKRWDDARRDGDRVYAVIRAIGAASDGKGQAVYAPSAEGQVKALRHAYALAGVSPAEIDLVEAHGTGTRVGDATELAALEEVYRAANSMPQWCALGSVKSQIGHTKAAAGAAGVIKAALALYHKVLPPTSKVRRPIEPLAQADAPFYLNTEARPWLSRPGRARRAAVSAFGFGGSNFHCVLEESAPEKPCADWDGDVQILAFSAADASGIAAALDEVERRNSWEELRIAAAEGRARYCVGDYHRLLLVARRDRDDLGSLLAEGRALVCAPAGHESTERRAAGGVSLSGELRGRVVYGSGPCPGQLALLFPGQGSQYVGMFRELACQFPAMQAALALADSLTPEDGVALSRRVYPPPPFSESDRALQGAVLRDTRHAQPALGALCLGLVRLLEHFGVRADLAAGHSFGELSALCAGGRFDDATFMSLAFRRGELMARCAGEADAGAMLAALAPLNELLALIEQHRLDVVVANKNAPRQHVLSGARADIERCGELLRMRGIATHPLAVSAAFHSRLVAGASDEFGRILESLTPGAVSIPVFANSTAEPYPAEAARLRELLAAQLVRPVEFVAQIEAMYRAGTRTFLEVGPDAKLTGIVRAILADRPCLCLAVDASRGSSGNIHDLACALASLAARGYAVDLARWDEAAGGPRVHEKRAGLTVTICGANARPQARIGTGPTAVCRLAPAGLATSEDARERARHPRFSPAPGSDLASNARPHSQKDAEFDVTMYPPERATRHSFNGHLAGGAFSASESRPKAGSQGESVPPAGPMPERTFLTQELRNARENLAALQRIAEQTAELHRQFLEGQARNQQSLLKLIEEEQRASRALVQLGAIEALPEEGGAPAAYTQGQSQPQNPARSQPARGDMLGFDEPARPLSQAAHNGACGARVGQAGVLPADHAPAPAGENTAGHRRDAALAVGDIVIELVAEKTGYPAEVLGLDMQLDADLGIDSIKRVEIFSALQERLPGMRSISPEQLGSIPTLRAIAETISSCGPEADSESAPAQEPARSSEAPQDRVAELLRHVVAEKTGYPVEMLELDMKLDTDLGIDSIKRVEIFSALQEKLPEMPALGPEPIGTFSTLREIASFVSRRGPSPPDRPCSSAALAREPATERIAQILLGVVSEKTGYPAEMLELDMKLDADLGIDSIKRVEILSALQDGPAGVQTVPAERLTAAGTLREIVNLLALDPGRDLESRAARAGGEPDRSAETASGSRLVANGISAAERNGHSAVRGGALDGVMASAAMGDERREPERAGVESNTTGEIRAAVSQGALLCGLAPRAVVLDALESRPDVRLRPGGAIWITDDGSPVATALHATLTARGYQPRLVAIEHPPPAGDLLAGLIIVAPRVRPGASFVASAFGVLRSAGAALERSGQQVGASLLTVARLDGRFGVHGLAPDSDVSSAALAGMAKSAAREWVSVHCKAIDLDAAFEPAELAAQLIVEELVKDGPSEVGLRREGRIALDLAPAPIVEFSNGARSLLDEGDAVVISGGARGITAEVAVALAEAFHPRLVLLGRTPAPSCEEPWSDALPPEPELIRALSQRAGRTLSPRELTRAARAVSAQHEVRRNLARIEAAGATVAYHAVDVRDGAAVRSILGRVQEESGVVRGLIHGAGALADRRITEQTDVEFERVYDTKMKGIEHLYAALDPQKLAFLALFSSSSARFGRAGQGAYAAANEALNKWAQRQAALLPRCRVVSFNWGPWHGGMVTDSLKSLFEKEGLGLIPPRKGAAFMIDVLRASTPSAVELVVLAQGAPPEPCAAARASRASCPAPATQSAELVSRRDVSIASLPVLESHVIDGHAVLPLALILEWLVEGAVARNPGLVAIGLDNLRLYKGVIIGAQPEMQVEICVGKAARCSEHFRVPVELRGTLSDGRPVQHARSEIILADRHPSGVSQISQPGLPRYRRSRGEIYREVLFHGAAMQGIARVEGCGPRGVTGWVRSAPEPARWIKKPMRGTWLTDPLAIDCAFQLVVVWSREQRQANSLPTSVRRFRQFRAAFPSGGVRVCVAIRHAAAHRAVADIEFLDSDGGLVARLDAYECVIDTSLNQAFLRNQMTACLDPAAASMPSPS
jgi:acyl transferase domain-containing protein/acyl carrier protein